MSTRSAALSRQEFPRAILHFDGDSFFASVEQAMDYRLRGKPVITGGERGAATSLSYEAKRLGLHRGMTIGEIKARCPDVIVVKSNYIAYATFAQRMYRIVRKFAPTVEEYSIDECFADITGMESTSHKPYEAIAEEIKAELEDSLGLTFGVGLASTKTLAKAASKAHKPAGFTSVPESFRLAFLEGVYIHDVWGLGGATGSHLQGLGIQTACSFVEKSDAWLTEHNFGKAYRDVWLELRGHMIKRVHDSIDETDDSIGSLMTTRTFKPPSTSRSFIFAQLSKNVERVCEKARRHRVKARGISFYLKTQEFTYHAVSLELAIPIVTPDEILTLINKHFDEVYAEGILYRATGITLRSFVPDHAAMNDLFGESTILQKRTNVFKAVDSMNAHYGKETVFLASTLRALVPESVRSKNRARPSGTSFAGSRPERILQRRKTLSLPYLGVAH
jgi:DNA polymerase IV